MGGGGRRRRRIGDAFYRRSLEMGGVKVHGLPISNNTARVLAVLNEKGEDFDLVPVNILTGAHKKQPFLSLNPFGQIPVLEDGDLTLFESRAITKYLANKHKETSPDLLRLGSASESAAVAVWLEVEAHHFAGPAQAVFVEFLFKPLMGGATDLKVVEAEAEKVGKVLDVYEERLTKSRYLAGDHFTLADLHHLPTIHNLMKTPKADLVKSRPHVLAWWEEISSRPAWKKTAAGMVVGMPSKA